MRILPFILSFLSCLTIHQTGKAQNLFNAAPLEESPVIDGLVTPEEWALCDTARSFVQLEPDKGLPSTEKTLVFMGYDKRKVYIAFQCFQDPETIIARIPNRDRVDDSDDVIAVILDTYGDGRTALGFFVNPLGTLTDFKITDDGKNLDFLWDTEWEAEANINEDGWSVELSIPLEGIQYNKKLTTWGINFGRVIRNTQETCWWSSLTENFRVSQGGELSGLNFTSKRENKLMLFPYMTLRYENSDFSGEYNKVKFNAGGDASYKITSSLTANVTIFPNFATVEGDEERINLTRWELNFPDKRIFFQNGNELFSNRIRTFYSRRIGDIDYGAKVTGKAGAYNINLLHSMTSGDPAEEIDRAFFTGFRIKRDILKSSTVGMTVTDKSFDGGGTTSFSADYYLNLGETWKLTGQFVGSSPGDFWSHSGWFVRFARENNVYHYHIRYTELGENFKENVNQTGFIPDDNRKELDGDVNYRWWFNKKVMYFDLSGKNNVFWSQQGILRSWYLTYSTRLYLKNRFSFDLAYNNEYKLFEKFFYNHFYRGVIGYNTDEWSFGSIAYEFGRNFDRDYDLVTGKVRVKPFEKLVFEYQLNWLKFEPDEEGNSTFINVISATFNFNKDLWIRVFTQNNTSINKYYLYTLIGWRFKPPFGAAYLIFNSDHQQMSPLERPNEVIQGHGNILFFKVTYPLMFFKKYACDGTIIVKSSCNSKIC